MTRILICSLSAVEDISRREAPSHLVTLIDPHTPVARPASIEPENHLRLDIHDITEPMDLYTAPQTEHVETLIGFVDRWPREEPMLIHCWAGLSRSTAAALIALSHIEGPGGEDEAARRLRKATPTARPNRRLIALADRVLDRQGRLVAAVEALEETDIVYEGVPGDLPLEQARRGAP